MNIGVLGTGNVGRTLGTKLLSLGHRVMLGSRTADNETAAEWAKGAGDAASHGTFAGAAEHGELLLNCVSGARALDALAAAGAERMNGKVLIDVTNPLDFSKGFPPTLLVSNDTSLGEEIQRAYPEVKVVKALNTVSCDIMVDPGRLPGDHVVFTSGNDASAKGEVAALLTSFGWKRIIDLGDITTARGTESYLLLWVRMYQHFGTGHFNIAIAKA
jgi:hypothetical protein